MIHRGKAYARAGLIGNPSDGYFGKTISIILRNYGAAVACYESPRLTILPTREGRLEFDSIDGQPTRLFFLLVVPENAGGQQHLKALARISRFLRDDDFRARLESAGSADEIFGAIADADSKF